jgi:alpha-glucuronidase
MFRILITLFLLGLAAAESGIDAWLRYAPLPRSYRSQYTLPSSIVALNSTVTSPVYTAGQELKNGIKGIFGKSVQVYHGKQSGLSIVVGTVDEYTKVYGDLQDPPSLESDGFWLSNKGKTIQILGQNERGALYGAFEYLSMLAQGNFSKVAYATNPNGQLRWVNQWDNMDGTIERGYGGASIFFANNSIVDDLTRASEYARILASIRINAVVVNNVNANYTTLEERNIKGLGRIADAFRPYGVQLGLSLDFASPMELGGLKTYDPLDPDVIDWWDKKTQELYESVPDMAGYLVKADSEGTPGPLTYNRTLAQGANLFAKAVEPYGGVVMFRAFVYNKLHEYIWREGKKVYMLKELIKATNLFVIRSCQSGGSFLPASRWTIR